VEFLSNLLVGTDFFGEPRIGAPLNYTYSEYRYQPSGPVELFVTFAPTRPENYLGTIYMSVSSTVSVECSHVVIDR
jgi:hypothetical protein